jgi:hypothetical protein
MQGSFYSHVKDTMMQHEILPTQQPDVVMIGTMRNREAPKPDVMENVYVDALPWNGSVLPADYIKTQWDKSWTLPEAWAQKILTKIEPINKIVDCFNSKFHKFIPLWETYTVSYQVMYGLSARPELLQCVDGELVGFLSSVALKPPLTSLPKSEGPNPDVLFYQVSICTHEDIEAAAAFIRCCLTSTAWATGHVKEGDSDNSLLRTTDVNAWMTYMKKKCHDSTLFEEKWKEYFAHVGYMPYKTVPAKNLSDEEYARLVKGAMVNTAMNVVWTPADEMENSRIDDDNFTAVMWSYLQVTLTLCIVCMLKC